MSSSLICFQMMHNRCDLIMLRNFSLFSYCSKVTPKHMVTVSLLFHPHPYIIITVSMIDSSRHCPYTTVYSWHKHHALPLTHDHCPFLMSTPDLLSGLLPTVSSIRTNTQQTNKCEYMTRWPNTQWQIVLPLSVHSSHPPNFKVMDLCVRLDTHTHLFLSHWLTYVIP